MFRHVGLRSCDDPHVNKRTGSPDILRYVGVPSRAALAFFPDRGFVSFAMAELHSDDEE